MHARQRILTNESFKDGIGIVMKWVVARPASYVACDTLKKCEKKRYFYVETQFYIGVLL
jgi:hypothetical protein